MRRQGIVKVIPIHPVGTVNEQNFTPIHPVVVEVLNSVWTKVNRQIGTAVPRDMPLVWLKIQRSHTGLFPDNGV